MKKIVLTILVTITSLIASNAQTWNGSVSNVWTNPLNWTPNAVPTATSNVTLNATGFSPKLQGATTIGAFASTAGATLDFNGFALTVGGINAYTTINSATLVNTNAVTDIVLNINTGTAGYFSQLNSCTINDHVTINVIGNDQFIEGGGLNIFNGNVIMNVNSSSTVTTSQTAISQFNGNFNFNRLSAGTSNIFNSGATITGNVNIQNTVGGATNIGSTGTNTAIGGTVITNITNPISPSTFTMFRVKNATSGGTINVQNSLGLNIQSDTLKVTTLTVQGYKGNAYGYFFNNKIEGNTIIEDDITYGSGYNTDIRANTFTGSATFTNKGSNALLETNGGVTSSNIYNGNTIFNCNGSGSVYISHDAKSTFNGNLTINRTVAGYTRAFLSGATITGNLIYNNTASGDNDLGNLSNLTSIAGTVNMNVNLSPIGRFEMFRIVNQTSGGKINVKNSRGFNLRNDSLKVDSLNVLFYRGSAYGYFYDNKLDGHLSIADSVTYSSGYETYLRNNTVNGNTFCTIYGTNTLNEADVASSANTFNGNVTFQCNGSGSLYTSHGSKSTFNGNVIINRTIGGVTKAFNAGATITGNLSYTKNSFGGASEFGHLSNKTSISGTVNMNVTQTIADNFELFWLVNAMNGGAINVNNTKACNIRKDTLLLTSLNVTGYGGNAYAYLYDNQITGNLTLQDVAGYTGGYESYLRKNTINGSVTCTIMGTNTFNEADVASSANVFNGNVVFNMNGTGALYNSHGSKSTYNGNLTINRTVSGITKSFNAGAIITGNLSYTKNGFGGASEFGHLSNKTSIGGTVNMNVTQTTADNFELFWLVNATTGGSITVINTKTPNIQKDTVKVALFSVTGYGGNGYAYIYDNRIEGNFTIADISSFGGGYESYIRNSTVTGNTNITVNGSNTFKDGDVANSGNIYQGDITYARNSGILNVATGDTNTYAGNLNFNNTIALPINAELIKFVGATNTNIDQLGTGKINIQKLLLNKTASAKVTLNKPVIISTIANLLTGYINSTTTNPLIFLDNINHTSASDNSHVVGCVTKVGNDIFSFPLGNGIGYHPMAITAPAAVTDSFQSCIILKHPSDDGYNVASKDAALIQIAPYHYWTLNQISGTNSETVSLGWSIPCANTVIASLPGMAVARWNGTQWNNLGNASTTGTNALGTVTQTGTTANYGVFALGTTSALNSWQITSVVASASTICAGVSTTLTASGANTYNWMPGNLSGTSVVVTPASTTTYTITGTSSTGCITTATRIITVNPLPNVTTTASATTVCSGSPTTITASNANTYTWLPGGATTAAITVSPTATTTYTVTGTTTSTGCTKTATRLITVNPLPNVTATATLTTLCSGTPTTITAANANTYTWLPGGATTAAITVSPSATTTYTVTGTITSTGCTKTATRLITVNPLPNVTTTATLTTVCSGTPTTITASNANTFTWNPGSLTGTSITVSPTATTTYTVTGTTTSTGCTKTATRVITVTNCTTNLNAKLFLQGYYNGSGLMKNVLFNQGALPSITGQCDWVTLNLHNATFPYALVTTELTTLQTNGNIATSYVNKVGQSFYLAIKHRNSIETWSATPVAFINGTVSYDFTNAITKAYGSNQVLVSAGVYAFYSGDINQNGSVENGDYTLWETDANNFALGYLSTDLDGNGSVGNEDYIFWEANSIGFVGVVKP